MPHRARRLPLSLLAALASSALAFSGTTTGPVALRETAALSGRPLAVVPRDTSLTLTVCTPEWCVAVFGDVAGFVHRSVLRLSDADEGRAPPFAVSLATCDDARAAGVAPLRRGDPGYRADLDPDGDGTACE